MGEAYKLDCDTCAYTKNIFVGFGFSYMSLESIASFVQDTVLKRRIGEFIGNPSTRYDAYDAIYVCPVCQAIRNELFIEMISDSSQYKISYACPRCASVMEQEHIENNVPVHLSCPAWEKGKLKATFYMDWD
ncbi:hypothetical protein [Paenibacillus polymyxa]|uniref:Uncharacterized protein n=1 Tax=Paenibacillus polymyxa (strain SC2) TaxID=886882 RepID=E3E8S4_PAEPS|nr:hypothetical protein [Paenibacillus polymyxa]ADO57783.1 hypothetical protein PPSC2_17900 [Paenibacillus polymyxa SC2]WPQ55520.1 hypothetical protein SKN87_18215 [Paenibacillus polymyxa]